MDDIYQWILKKRDDDTLEKIAQVKRFSECLIGDHLFRDRLTQSPGQALEITHDRGIDLDPLDLAPMWKNGLKLSFSDKDKDGRLPLVNLWLDWLRDLRKFRDSLRGLGEELCPNRRFVSWRQRQITRSDSQIGDMDKTIPHPVVAFELSQGCTRGCWFCGLRADSFKGYLPYNQKNRVLWREILTSFKEIFGGLIETGFCYWATEPTDNPDYLSFIDDFYKIAGIYPQTTSAAPAKNLEWSRKLLKRYASLRSIPCRFSILDVDTLNIVHSAFTPRELLTTELILHVKGSIIPKAQAGRLRKSNDKFKEKEKGIRHFNTIACVSGFLVNMVTKNIKLISPCAASERWPLGYRIHAEAEFTDALSFQDKLSAIVDHCMPDLSGMDGLISFRSDLNYRETAEGMELKNAYMRYTFDNNKLWRIIGSDLIEGKYKWDPLIERLTEKGIDILSAMSMLQNLYEKGLLDDEPKIPVQL